MKDSSKVLTVAIVAFAVALSISTAFWSYSGSAIPRIVVEIGEYTLFGAAAFVAIHLVVVWWKAHKDLVKAKFESILSCI